MRGGRILGLKKYQGRNPHGYFQDLSWEAQRRARNWLWLWCRKWGRNLPQWRFAILVGQAKRLALNPPRQRGVVACRPRREVMPRSVAIAWRDVTPLKLPPGYIVPRLGCARKPRSGNAWACHLVPATVSPQETSPGGTGGTHALRNGVPVQ